jgi:hypothetical protein
MERDELKKRLDFLIEKYPILARKNVKQGDLIPKKTDSWHQWFYEVDDAEIHKKVGDLDKDTKPMLTIWQTLDHRFCDLGLFSDLAAVFMDEAEDREGILKVLPFSKIFEKGWGNCVEKTLLFQLWIQDKMDAYFVNGYLSWAGKTGNDRGGPHSFSILFPPEEERAYLIDINNPWALIYDGRKCLYPFSAVDYDLEMTDTSIVFTHKGNELNPARTYKITTDDYDQLLPGKK